MFLRSCACRVLSSTGPSTDGTSFSIPGVSVMSFRNPCQSIVPSSRPSSPAFSSAIGAIVLAAAGSALSPAPAPALVLRAPFLALASCLSKNDASCCCSRSSGSTSDFHAAQQRQPHAHTPHGIRVSSCAFLRGGGLVGEKCLSERHFPQTDSGPGRYPPSSI
jgi:hypothetical protein